MSEIKTKQIEAKLNTLEICMSRH